MQVRSNIRESLWNKAGWRGVFFQTGGGGPPVIALLFEDQEAAAAIFRGWRSDIGRTDKENVLRISVVRGIDRRHPSHYRVVVGSNFTKDVPEGSTVFSMARMQTVEPETPANLERFLEYYRYVGWYVLAYAVLDEASGVPTLAMEHGIAKREINLREAWEIGRHDPDVPGVFPGDDPIIPQEHEKDAPVLALLRWKKDQRTKR
jgi:hypothetical protein